MRDLGTQGRRGTQQYVPAIRRTPISGRAQPARVTHSDAHGKSYVTAPSDTSDTTFVG
jgi:hypothetical protein